MSNRYGQEIKASIFVIDAEYAELISAQLQGVWNWFSMHQFGSMVINDSTADSARVANNEWPVAWMNSCHLSHPIFSIRAATCAGKLVHALRTHHICHLHNADDSLSLNGIKYPRVSLSGLDTVTTPSIYIWLERTSGLSLADESENSRVLKYARGTHNGGSRQKKFYCHLNTRN